MMKTNVKIFGVLGCLAIMLTACGATKSQVQQPVPQQTVAQAPVQQPVQQPMQTQVPQQPAQMQIPPQPQGMQQGSISLDQAKIAAVTHAGLNVNNVTFTKTAQDYDDGLMKWEIEFVNGNNLYEYEVSAYDASIIKYEVKQVAYNQGNIPQQQGQVPQQGMQQTQGIDVESAKSIAATSAGYNVSSVTFTKTKYDFDDGMALWEIEFVANNQKYEYEISATNGAIVKSEVKSVFYD